MPFENLIKGITAVILIGFCVSCGGPVFITHPIKDEPRLMVGLASYNDPSKAAGVRHDHPVDWSKADLHAILKRLLIQEGGGLMDSSKPLQPVFSSGDMDDLVPSLHQTFKLAKPSDWIVFALWGSSRKSQALEVTSGGMFLQDQRLHIILANHRERVSSERDGIHAIHSNPFHSLKDVKGRLIFHPASYVIDSRNNWIIGGFESPVSELILDYQTLLDTQHQEKSTDAEEVTASQSSNTPSDPSPSSDSEVDLLQEEISNLKEELSRLKHQINQQAADRSQTNGPVKSRLSSESDPE